jgi:hypothetical protein
LIKVTWISLFADFLFSWSEIRKEAIFLRPIISHPVHQVDSGAPTYILEKHTIDASTANAIDTAFIFQEEFLYNTATETVASAATIKE